MDKKQSEGLNDEKRNNDWCNALEEFWDEILFHPKERLRLIIEKLSLAVVPIAILPFHKQYLYAKYVSIPHNNPDYNLLKTLKMLVSLRRPDDVSKQTPLASGTYKSICLEAPYIWQKFMIFQKDILEKDKVKIDYEFYKAEDKLVKLKVKKILRKIKMNKYENEIEGHYLVPLYFGTIPVYCLMFLTNTITPDIFNARYLRETFDMIGRIGESILNDNFVSLWENFCENYKDVGEPKSPERKNVFKILEKRLLGKAPKRNFSSWVHSLPGHWIFENKGQERITENFIDKWKNTKDRFIEDEKWYVRHIKKLMDIAKEIKLFAKVHDVRNTKDLNKIKNIINKENNFIMESNECEWFKNIINILAKSKLEEAQIEFYKLKSILNLTDYKNKTISAGFIYEWPRICKQNSVHELYGKKSIDIDIYKAEVYISNPFRFVELFYSFINAFNKHKELQACKIQQLQIVNRCINESTVIEIICKLSRKFPSDLETLLSDWNKHTMILKNKAVKRNTSFFLCKLIRTRECEIINSKKTIKFRLNS